MVLKRQIYNDMIGRIHQRSCPSPMEIDELNCYKCGRQGHYPRDCPDRYVRSLRSPTADSGNTGPFNAYSTEGQHTEKTANNDFKSDGSDSDSVKEFQPRYPGTLGRRKRKVKPKYTPVSPNSSVRTITIDSDSDQDRGESRGQTAGPHGRFCTDPSNIATTYTRRGNSFIKSIDKPNAQTGSKPQGKTF